MRMRRYEGLLVANGISLEADAPAGRRMQDGDEMMGAGELGGRDQGPNTGSMEGDDEDAVVKDKLLSGLEDGHTILQGGHPRFVDKYVVNLFIHRRPMPAATERSKKS